MSNCSSQKVTPATEYLVCALSALKSALDLQIKNLSETWLVIYQMNQHEMYIAEK